MLGRAVNLSAWRGQGTQPDCHSNLGRQRRLPFQSPTLRWYQTPSLLRTNRYHSPLDHHYSAPTLASCLKRHATCLVGNFYTFT